MLIVIFISARDGLYVITLQLSMIKNVSSTNLIFNNFSITLLNGWPYIKHLKYNGCKTQEYETFKIYGQLVLLQMRVKII